MKDADVSRQIQQMIRFIRQEAEEKANEISVAAEEVYEHFLLLFWHFFILFTSMFSDVKSIDLIKLSICLSFLIHPNVWWFWFITFVIGIQYWKAANTWSWKEKNQARLWTKSQTNWRSQKNVSSCVSFSWHLITNYELFHVQNF